MEQHLPPLGAITDDLVLRAKAGDRSAYDQLFARVAARLGLYVRARLGPGLRGRLEPEDVLQEVYLEAHRSFAGFEARGERAFMRWLCGIAEHRLRDLSDRFSARKRAAPGPAAPSSALAALPGSGPGPSTACDGARSQARLLEALQALTAEERDAILLRYVRDLTLREVASELGRSEPTVRRVLARALVRLGEALSGG